MLRARVDRHRCIGAGNCITIAPTAFDWLKGGIGKADVIDVESIDEELLREAASSCPTDAIVIEEIEALLPWQLRGKAGPERRVLKTFMFTDIVKSTNLAEAMGDDAWLELLRWHDETLRSLFAAHHGEEAGTTGDGFFVGFDSPDAAVTCAVAIQRRLADHRKQHGFAPQVRIGLHASEAAQVEKDFRGKGVHEASRIAALAEGGEIVASRATVGPSAQYPVTEPRTVSLKGISEPVEVVSIDWR
jgi:class 3 adenylate cyclase